MIRKILYYRLWWLFVSIFPVKFYVKQNLPPWNYGYESYHLKNPGNYYFYGTKKEFVDLYAGRRMK